MINTKRNESKSRNMKNSIVLNQTQITCESSNSDVKELILIIGSINC